LPTFLKFGNAKNQIFVLSLQEIMGSYKTGGLEQNWGEPGPGLKPPLPSTMDIILRRNKRVAKS